MITVPELRRLAKFIEQKEDEKDIGLSSSYASHAYLLAGYLEVNTDILAEHNKAEESIGGLYRADWKPGECPYNPDVVVPTKALHAAMDALSAVIEYNKVLKMKLRRKTCPSCQRPRKLSRPRKSKSNRSSR